MNLNLKNESKDAFTRTIFRSALPQGSSTVAQPAAFPHDAFNFPKAPVLEKSVSVPSSPRQISSHHRHSFGFAFATQDIMPSYSHHTVLEEAIKEEAPSLSPFEKEEELAAACDMEWLIKCLGSLPSRASPPPFQLSEQHLLLIRDCEAKDVFSKVLLALNDDESSDFLVSPGLVSRVVGACFRRGHSAIFQISVFEVKANQECESKFWSSSLKAVVSGCSNGEASHALHMVEMHRLHGDAFVFFDWMSDLLSHQQMKSLEFQPLAANEGLSSLCFGPRGSRYAPTGDSNSGLSMPGLGVMKRSTSVSVNTGPLSLVNQGHGLLSPIGLVQADASPFVSTVLAGCSSPFVDVVEQYGELLLRELDDGDMQRELLEPKYFDDTLQAIENMMFASGRLSAVACTSLLKLLEQKKLKTSLAAKLRLKVFERLDASIIRLLGQSCFCKSDRETEALYWREAKKQLLLGILCCDKASSPSYPSLGDVRFVSAIMSTNQEERIFSHPKLTNLVSQIKERIRLHGDDEPN